MDSKPQPEGNSLNKVVLSQFILKSIHAGVSKLKEAPDAVANASKMLKRTLSTETVISPTVDYEMAKFTQLTSFHGVMRWYNCTNWRSRIFWMLVVLGSLIAFGVEVNSLIQDLLAKPTFTEVNFIYDADGLPFPSITICNSAMVQKSKVQKLAMPDDALKYVLSASLELESLYSYYNSSSLEQLKAVFDDFNDNYTRVNNKPFDILNFYNENGFNCSDMVKTCWFGGHQIPNCCSHAKPTLTTMGLCYQFSNLTNSSLLDRQFISGPAYGAKFLVDSQVDEYFDGVNQPFHEIGVIFFIHDNGEVPYVSSGGYAVSPGRKVYAGITFKHYKLLEEKDWGMCKQNWSDEMSPSVHPYTYANCQADCIAEKFRRKCSCTPLKYRTHSGRTALPLAIMFIGYQQKENLKKYHLDQPVCDPLNLYKCFDDESYGTGISDNSWYKDCDCSVECDRWEYQAQISYATILPTQSATRLLSRQNLSNDTKYIRENYLMIDIYLQDSSFTSYKQLQGANVVQTLSNIGGCMGMFIGASLITVVEVLVFLIKLVWTTASKQRQTKLVQKIESCENLQDLAKRHRLNSRTSVEDFYTQDCPRKLERPVSETSNSSRDSGQFSFRGSQTSTPERKEGMAFYIPAPSFSESAT